MKKVLAMVLAVFMLVSVLCVGVSADTALTFAVDSVSASAGQTVSVAVNIQNNPGLVGLRLCVDYDTSVLTPIEMKGQGSYALATFGPLDVSPLSIMWADAIHPDVTENGAIALITFQVAEDAPVGDYPLTLSVVDPDDIFNAAFDVIPFELVNGAVTVVDFTYGDVNDDGKVNVRDLGVMQQSLNGWGVAINMSAADVNADGKVNVRDLGVMQQHLNGWDVTLGGGTVTPPVNPDPEPPVDPDDYEPIVVDGVIQNPKAGVAYKLGLNQTAKGAVYYFTGVMSTYYGATDTAIDNAVDMYLENADGGYKLYFNDAASGAKQYIKLVQSGTHYNFTYGAEGSVFTLDAEKNALCAPCGDQICYMGTYGNYVTVGALTTEKLKDTDYLARLYVIDGGDLGGGDEPVDPPVNPDPEPPVEGGATIDFTDKANRVSYSTEQQVWAQNGITVTNDKASSTSNVGDYGGEGYPVRFYKTSALTVEYTGMSTIVFVCDDYKDTYAADLAASITEGTVSVDNTVVTVTFDTPVDVLFIPELAAQVRVHRITVNGDVPLDPQPPVDPDPQPPVDPDPKPPVSDWAVATELKVGVAYKLGLDQTAKGAVYYFIGTMSTYYGATDTAVDNAVDMYLETADGGYKLYFSDASGAKQYIKLVQSGTHYNFTFGAEGSVFTLDTELNALYAVAGDQVCYMGTYGNYVTVGTLTVEKLKDTDYIARLYESVSGDIGGGDEPVDPPVDPQPPVNPDPDEPVEGGAVIDFHDKANRVSYSTEQQVWAQNGITVTNDKASSTSNVGDYGGDGFPVRFYKTSALTVEYTGMTEIVFYCDDYKDTYATDLAASITTGTVSVDGLVVTVTFDTPVDSLFIEALAAQVRVDSIVVNPGEGGNTPSVPDVPSEPAGDLSVEDAPVAGVAYKFGMVQQNVSATSVYYLTGAMSSYYMATTTSADSAVDVYLEETNGGYYLYTMDEKGTKAYINMVVSGTHVNGQFGAATATTVYTFDTESYTLIAEIDGIPYWFGTRSDASYTTVGPVKVEYAGFYCQLYA